MLLLNPTENAIITYLSQRGTARVSQIKDFLHTKKIAIGQAQLYNIIHKLYTHQCLTKHGPLLSLSSKRIHERESMIQQFHHHADSDHTDRKHLRQKTFYAQSIYELDPIRNDAFHSFVRLQKTEKVYFYNSHPYFILSSPDLEGDFMQALASRTQVYFLTRDDYQADQIGAQRYHERSGIHVTKSNTQHFPRDGYMLNIIGDYMIECIFPKELTDAYDALFQQNDLTSDELRQQCRTLFIADYQCKLIIRQHASEAKRLSRLIEKCAKVE